MSIKIISVNAGSSSLKFQLYNMPSEEVLCSGIFERIGFEEGIFTIKVNGEKITKNTRISNHNEAVVLLLDALISYKVVESLDEIKGAGHRVVQGSDYFKESCIATDENLDLVLKFAELAPLHNKPNAGGCIAFKKELPNCVNTFVFDTAFHQTMTPESYMYAVPYSWYEDYKVRRYGAHGTSHFYVSNRVAQLMNKNIKDLKIITCHLGNGASISAVKGGICVNTSMGFTPLAGIMMGTRSGDIDPAIIPFVMKKTGMNADEVVNDLNKKSGMLGISGISADARDIEEAISNGNKRAELTHDVYVNRIINVVGGYVMQMGGVDVIVFTAGLGENATTIRAKILDAMKEHLSLVVDRQLNDKTHGDEVCLSKPESKVQVWVVPTNEELVIARDTYRIIGE